MGDDMIDAHPGHQATLAHEPEPGGAGAADDRGAEVPNPRLTAEIGQIFLADREVPERRDGVAPVVGLTMTGALTREQQDRFWSHRPCCGPDRAHGIGPAASMAIPAA